MSRAFGIEWYTVLEDVGGLGERDIERTALWMADALIDAAEREGRAAQDTAEPG